MSQRKNDALISLRLPADMLAELKARNVNVSELVRSLIAGFLARPAQGIKFFREPKGAMKNESKE